MINIKALLCFLFLIYIPFTEFSDKQHSVSEEISKIYDFFYSDIDRPKALINLDSLIELAKNEQNSFNEVALYNVKARLFNELGEYSKSIQIALIAESKLLKLNEPKILADIYLNLGNSYDLLGFYPKALEYNFKSLTIRDQINDTLGLNWCYNNIANIQQTMNDYEQAKSNYFKSLQFAQALKDTLALSIAYTNIASIYLEENKPDSAKYFVNNIFKLNESQTNFTDLIYAYGLLSDLFTQSNNLDSALYYQRLSTKYSELYGTSYENASAHSDLAYILLKNDKIKEAKKSTELALSLSLNNQNKETILSSYKTLYQIDSLQNDFKSALLNFQQAQIYQDSLQNEDAVKSAIRQQLKYDFDKKEALTQAELKRKQMQRNIFIGGFILMLGASLVILKQRNRISKEKDRSENLLLNILPYETAQELKQKGYADAQVINQVTVLFTDFKGFTQLSEKLSPSDLVAAIHECFSAFDRIMEVHKVEKIKTIGDAYMAAGGLPTVNTTHSVDVVRAALDIQAYMQNHIQEKMDKGLPYFEIRIGVHTGPVVAGIVGIKKFQYDIWGDTVNTASRMESSGAVGRVNVSQATYELVKQKFTCEYRGEIEAKGKGKIGMYFVTP